MKKPCETSQDENFQSKFKNGLSLEESDDLINISENSLAQGLMKSLSELRKVRAYSYKLGHNNNASYGMAPLEHRL
jgi:hypothetical protein